MPTHFQDPNGRTLLLRGVNLADGKFPTGQPSHLLSSLDTSAEATSQISYVDSPLRLAEAPTHLRKLRALGFNVLRLPVVWEALEHAGPGVYDSAYIAYVRSLVALCNDKRVGLRVVINPHQDLFSRFAGGSGAPMWALHACGLDPDGFAETHAAVRYAEWPAAADHDAEGEASAKGAKDPKAIPPMMWTSNQTRLACSTLFALFWAGKEVAPRCVIDGVNIQEYLQNHYFAAYSHLAEALGDLAFGWDSMNEPMPGYVGWVDLDKNERDASPMMGSAPTPIQAMRLGMGMAQTVDAYKLGKTGPHKKGTMTVKPGRGCWLKQDDLERWKWQRSPAWKMGTCVWALHGVWDSATGQLKEPGYFAQVFREGDWKSICWKAFFDKWAATIRKYSPQAVVLFQPPIFEEPPQGLLSSGTDIEHLGYSPHFYDALTVMKGHWHQYWNVDILRLLRGPQDITTKLKALSFGPAKVRKVISDQLGAMASDVKPEEGNHNDQRSLVPTLIGEIGIPFNLDNNKAYGDGDYTSHVAALDAILSGCDDHLLNYTLWNYSAVNNHEWGDHWNGEDLSIYCSETGSFACHQSLAGFRGAAAWCRPYVQSLKGKILRMSFDFSTSRFLLDIEFGEQGDAIIYLPWLHYRRDDRSDDLDVQVTISAGQWSLDDEQRLLYWQCGIEGRSQITLERSGGPLSPEQLGTVVNGVRVP